MASRHILAAPQKEGVMGMQIQTWIMQAGVIALTTVFAVMVLRKTFHNKPR